MGPYKVIRAESFLCHAVYRPSLCECYDLYGCGGVGRLVASDTRDQSIHIEGPCQLHGAKMTQHRLVHKGLTSADEAEHL